MLVDFAGTLRDAGHRRRLRRRADLRAAVATLDPTDLVDLYWAGRTTLVTRRDQVPVYDRVFGRYFLDGAARRRATAQVHAASSATEAAADLEVPETETHGEERDQRAASSAWSPPTQRTMRRKAFAACTPEELAALRRIMRTMRLTPPRRRTRRTRAGPLGPLARPAPDGPRDDAPARRARAAAPPRAPAAPSAADPASSTCRARWPTTRATWCSSPTPRPAPSSRVEVFCFGTRLTRITRELDRRRPDEALDRAAEAVVDWEGGTRIGDVARRVRPRPGPAGDVPRRHRGDLLRRARPRRPGRLLEPRWSGCPGCATGSSGSTRTRAARTDFVADTLGMMVAAPYVDVLLSGHDLASLEEFAAHAATTCDEE